MLNHLLSVKMNTKTIVMLVLLAIMVVVLVVLPMFTNKRRNKAINDLHSSLRPGDVIKTVGGIVGKIVEIKEISPVDKEMIIETGIGDSKTTLVFDIQAVYQVLSKVPVPATETPAPEANPENHEEPAPEANQTVIAEEQPAAEKVETPEPVATEPVSEETVATETPAAEEKPAAPKKPRKSPAKK